DLVLTTDHRRQGSLAHDALKMLHELLRERLPPGRPVGSADMSLFDELYERGVEQALRGYAAPGAEGVLTELMAIEIRKWREPYREQHQQYDTSCQDWEAPLVPTHLE